MLLGEFEALFAGTALLEGPLLAPIWVRFFVRLRAIVVVSCGVVFWENLRAEIFGLGIFAQPIRNENSIRKLFYLHKFDKTDHQHHTAQHHDVFS
jgi:hypothetical protein